jgi:hypothetical protein
MGTGLIVFARPGGAASGRQTYGKHKQRERDFRRHRRLENRKFAADARQLDGRFSGSRHELLISSLHLCSPGL